MTRIRRGSDVLDLAWDGLYRLVSVSTNGVVAESYRCDALGRRTATVNAEGTERHVWDGDHCLADVDEEGNVLRAYLWGPGVDNLLAVRVGGRNYAALTDIQGTVWGYADERGEIVARWTYDAWGNVLSEEVAPWAGELRAVRYRFQGRERSAATGLVHFRARWYDPETGRWLSPDPIGLEGGLNLHAFCGNDPVNYTDPSGTAVLAIRNMKGTPRFTMYAPWILGPTGALATEAFNLGVYHQQIIFEDEKGGSIGYRNTGRLCELSDEGYNRSHWHYDDKVMRQAVRDVLDSGEWEGDDYNAIFHNCQDFCDAVIRRYRELNGPKRAWRW